MEISGRLIKRRRRGGRDQLTLESSAGPDAPPHVIVVAFGHVVAAVRASDVGSKFLKIVTSDLPAPRRGVVRCVGHSVATVSYHVERRPGPLHEE